MGSGGHSNRGTTRVLRIVARLTGGSAHNVTLLSSGLDPERYETLLVHGRTAADEASFDHLARDRGCDTHVVPELGPAIRPRADRAALRELRALIARYRPHIVHTHTAKAGFLGRQAAAGISPRPVIVHTYHGHVLEGYFGPVRNFAYRSLERRLARASDCLIGVSTATVDDLVRLRIAPRERFRVIPIGLELARFADPDPAEVAAFRERSGAGPGDVLIGFVGRLVPIKRVDLILRAVAALRDQGVPVRLAVVGDGESRAELEGLARSLELGDAVRFHGFARDSAPAAAGADLAVIASDNEGTPVALIEAGAAGRPSVATDVGGVPDVVVPGTGVLAPPGDHLALAASLRELVIDPELRRELGARARDHVMDRFGVQRLLTDVDQLYTELLARH